MEKRCDNCKWFGCGCFDKECNYPELESWEPKYPENLDRRCTDCIHYDAAASEEPCKTCSRTIGKPSFRQKDEEEQRAKKLQRNINTVRNVCSKCKYRDEKYSKAPCSECFEIETHPKFEAVKVKDMNLCCNCKYGTVEFESYPCNECFQYPGLPKWVKEETRECLDCVYLDVWHNDEPCKTCFRKNGKPNFKRRIEVELKGAEEVTERLKRIIEKDQFLVGIVHPSYMEMHDPKIYYFTSDYCLEEGMDVLVEEDDGTRAWGKVFVPSIPFENEQIEFIREMGEEIGRVVGIFTPFHKCEEE